ncbi:ATP-binding protein [Branchiibius sp. NY16-3462-2]|uniref:ATP-binding protein n=1 Tax=Branchiibius sp. NY16-3462-2 TaxID=1807500 RepID=UPI00079A9AAD|nr:ATP-binding protein [Branchiibius sp. NY16-3462-2]KYH46208.1 hypothetical protein AZH51_11335 [Branchiibius sp. NY16-3462-2]
MVQPSPYSPGAVAHHLAGRQEQLAEVDERLDYLTQLGRLVPRIRIDHGPRGLGKTSLMREVQKRALARGALTIWVTAGEAEGLVAAIAAQCERALTELIQERGRLRHALNSVDLEAELGVPGIASIKASHRHSDTRPKAAARDLEALIVAVASAGIGKGKTGIVLFIDEIQSADPDGLRALSYAWQHLQSEAQDLPVAFFGAGLPESVGHINRAVSNSERFAYKRLGSLLDDAVAVALGGPARELGVLWDHDALGDAVQEARGYPHTVQLIGDYAWGRAGRPDPGGRITRHHVAGAILDTRKDLAELYEARLAKISGQQEVELVGALAVFGDGPIRRIDLAKTLGKTSNDLSLPRQKLIAAGIIAESGYGQLEFTIPGFAAFVRHHYGLSDEEPPPPTTLAARMARDRGITARIKANVKG